MNTLELNKKEIGYIFMVTALFPVMTFTLGFSLAGDSRSNTNNEQSQQAISRNESIKPEIQSVIHVSPTSTNQHHTGSIHDDKSIDVTQQNKDDLLELKFQYEVQAGVFSNISNAKQYQNYLNGKGLSAEIVAKQILDNSFLYRIVLGSYDSKSEANRYVLSTKQLLELELYIKEIDNKNRVTIASL